jgi:hypothetical protein
MQVVRYDDGVDGTCVLQHQVNFKVSSYQAFCCTFLTEKLASVTTGE